MTNGKSTLQALVGCAGLLAITGILGCGSLVDSYSGRSEACAILAIGKPATGTIIRLIDTGTTINDDPVVEFIVRVAPPEGAAYEARTKSLVSRLDVPAIQPGRIVPVKYDPQRPERIALDLWECPNK
ncbi:MAG: hypothetical protein BWK76_15275 [Desulfobulbaceae bacterium A2]|nr:MAG: hypothetical protein BWK76_15275 [Desulfobulbaceae bacterium A2]